MCVHHSPPGRSASGRRPSRPRVAPGRDGPAVGRGTGHFAGNRCISHLFPLGCDGCHNGIAVDVRRECPVRHLVGNRRINFLPGQLPGPRTAGPRHLWKVARPRPCSPTEQVPPVRVGRKLSGRATEGGGTHRRRGHRATPWSSSMTTTQARPASDTPQSPHLERALSNRHIQLIAIGGASGTRRFIGSG